MSIQSVQELPTQWNISSVKLGDKSCDLSKASLAFLQEQIRILLQSAEIKEIILKKGTLPTKVTVSRKKGISLVFPKEASQAPPVLLPSYQKTVESVCKLVKENFKNQVAAPCPAPFATPQSSPSCTTFPLEGVVVQTKALGKAILRHVQPIETAHTGISPQFRATLIKETGEQISVFIKAAKNVNEAIGNYRLFQTNDSLSPFIPHFYAALDRRGHPISEESLKQRKVPYAQNCYIILEDLKTGRDNFACQDFKFCDPDLLKCQEERICHHHILSGLAERFLYFCLSFLRKKLPFILSAPQTKKITGFLSRIQRLCHRIPYIFKTEDELYKQFSSLEIPAMQEALSDLTKLKQAVSKSKFSFVDSSLLFITKQEKGIKKLEFRLVDLSHSMEEREGLHSFSLAKQKMERSIETLLTFAGDILKTKQQSLLSLKDFIEKDGSRAANV